MWWYLSVSVDGLHWYVNDYLYLKCNDFKRCLQTDPTQSPCLWRAYVFVRTNVIRSGLSLLPPCLWVRRAVSSLLSDSAPFHIPLESSVSRSMNKIELLLRTLLADRLLQPQWPLVDYGVSVFHGDIEVLWMSPNFIFSMYLQKVSLMFRAQNE